VEGQTSSRQISTTKDITEASLSIFVCNLLLSFVLTFLLTSHSNQKRRLLEHKYLQKLISVMFQPTLTIMSEYYEGHLMHILKEFPRQQIIPSLTMIAEALQYLHSNNIVHRFSSSPTFPTQEAFFLTHNHHLQQQRSCKFSSCLHSKRIVLRSKTPTIATVASAV
jgi:serine/threonine protein kinase